MVEFSNFGAINTQPTPNNETTQTPSGWDLDDLKTASNADGSTDYKFSKAELSEFLETMGVTDQTEREALMEHIMNGEATVSAQDLLAFFDTDETDTISEEEMQTKLTESKTGTTE